MRPLCRAAALLGVATLGLVSAACSSGREAATVTVTVTAPTGRQEVSEPEPADLRKSAELVAGRLPRSRSGHLGYVGRDANVYVVDPVTGGTVQVTEDRSSADTQYGIFHTGLAWSRAGELAYAETDPDAFTSSLFLTVPGSGKVERLTAKGGMLIYASWSPATCNGVSCRELAYIADADGEPGGKVTFNVLEFVDGGARSVRAERADEVYFSWAKRPNRLVQHVVGRQSRLAEVDLASGASRRIRGRFAPFLAPAVVGDRIVYAVEDESVDKPVVAVRDDAVVVRVPRGVRRVVFAPSPDGRRLAFAIRGASQLTPDQAFEEPWVADLETGEMEAVGPLTLWAEAFYWSPDSRKLAYLTYLDTEYRQYNQWRIYDAATGEDTGFVSFQPTPTFDTLTTFFDQFGQSHRFWSPDSRYLTYAAVSDRGAEHVWLLDTRKNGERILVADGVVGIFTWR